MRAEWGARQGEAAQAYTDVRQADSTQNCVSFRRKNLLAFDFQTAKLKEIFGIERLVIAGGGWAYVGAMHDSFPHAIELSKRGYNAFAIIYRPDAQTAYEDLARAISFIFANADALGVDTRGYSVWGGSAGGRMAATISSYGVQQYGGTAGISKPGAAVIQYTGHTDYNRNGEPPTFVCVGESDGIASYRTMKSRIDNLAAMGVATEYHSYAGMGHGFGLGIGTVAEGWFEKAVAFWERNGL